MSDYISRSALLKKMFPYDGIDKKTYSINAKAVEVAIVDATATDVVEVVRCKDCKCAYINAFSAQSGVAVCRFWTNQAEGNTIVVQQDDFCNYGERSDENAE